MKAERCSEHAIFKPLTKRIQQFPSFEVVSDLVESERKQQHLQRQSNGLPGEESFGMDLHQGLLYQRKTLGRPRLDVWMYQVFHRGVLDGLPPLLLPFFGVLGGELFELSRQDLFLLMILLIFLGKLLAQAHVAHVILCLFF